MKHLYTTILILVLLSIGMPAAAQFCNGQTCKYIPLEQLPGQSVDPNQGVNFPSYLADAFKVLIILGGMFAVATFVFGGVMYMVSDVLDKKDFARRQMQRAVYGVLLLLGSYLLLTTINPQLGILNFNPGSLATPNNINPATGQPINASSFANQPSAAARASCENPSLEWPTGGRVVNVPGGWTCQPR